MKRRVLLGTAVGAMAALAGCQRSRGSAGEYDVGMSASDFLPELLEVAVGTTVVWRNTSSRAHTVTAYDDGLPEGAAYFASGGYDSESAARTAYMEEFGGAIHSGGTYEHTFETPGEYTYFCVPHEQGGMVAKLRVTE